MARRSHPSTAHQRVSPAFLTRALDQLQEPLFIKDRNHRFVYLNAPAIQVMGRPAEDLIGRTDFDLFTPEQAQVFWDHDEKAFRDGTNINEEGITWHGQDHWISTSKARFTDPETGQQYLVGTIRDLTDVHRARQAIQQRDRKYRDLFENSLAAVFRVDTASGQVLDANRHLAELMGFDGPQEMIGTDTADSYADRSDQLRLALQLRQHGRVDYYEMEFVTRAGESIWLAGSVWLTDDGEVSEGVMIDVSDRRAAQEQLREAYDHLEQRVQERTAELQDANRQLLEEIAERQALQREREALAAIVEHTDDICVIKDLDLRVISTNQAFARAAGKSSPAEMIGKTDAEIFGVSPDDEPVRSYMADERAAQNLPPGQAILREEDVIYPDGSVRTVYTQKFPVHDAAGRLVATANISRDVTDTKAIERQMRKARRDLAQAVETERQRLAGELHDSVGQRMVALQLMLRAAGDHRDALSDGARDPLDKAREMVVQLIADLRDACHQLYPAALATLGLCPSLRKLCEPLNDGEAQVEYSCSSHTGDHPRLDGLIEIALYRIGQEAISNAIRHASPATVAVHLHVEEDRAELSITDDGQGFDPATVTEGLGIGQMRSRAEGVGGSLLVDSGPEGTTVRAVVPLGEGDLRQE